MTIATIDHALGLRAASTLWALLVCACSGGDAHSPSQREPLPETRAREVIARAVHESGARPMGKYFITVKGGRQLEVDVGVVGHRYGIAYISGTERQSLGDAVPAFDVGSSSLHIQRDLKERDKAVLILHDLGYVADEQLGTEREKTGIAAELRLQRDVRDFLAKAQGENWP